MKFKGPLIEATLLKRSFHFLMEVVLKNRRRRTLYCPNLDPLANCDVLGSRLWFSTTNRLSQGYLDIVELMEVNGGWLVAVNPSYGPTLVAEALDRGTLPELKGYRFVHFNSFQANHPTPIELLLQEEGKHCFVTIEPVFFGDDKGDGYFPETQTHSLSILQELITQKERGHRAIVLYSVQHNGIHCVRPRDSVHPAYGDLLRTAVAKGVEVIAYRTNINLTEIALESRIPVLLSEDILSD